MTMVAVYADCTDGLSMSDEHRIDSMLGSTCVAVAADFVDRFVEVAEVVAVVDRDSPLVNQ